MIKLILVRHGKTTSNEKGVLSGLTDSALSETGKLQSQKIADYLKYTNIDKIYTTPFKRTKETIEKLAETKNIKVEESSQLNEINFGDFEGLSFKDIEKNYPEEVQNIVERHIGAGITEEESVKLGLPKKSYIPQTIEEKIVAHADNLLSGTKDVDIDFDIAKWKRKIDKPEENIKRLIELDNELIKAFEDD